MAKPRVLVIDDEESVTETVASFLSSKGYPVTIANDGDQALEHVRTGGFPIILSDIYIDRVTGLDILRAARQRDPDACVILMTARSSVGTTVEAEAGGAFDYLAKPFDLRGLLDVVERAARSLLEPEPEAPAEDMGRFGGLIGFSPAMVEVYKRIARFARSDETVLVCGETGTGKELVARAIHDHSARACRPFAAVDAGAVSGTLWESEVFGAVRGAFTGADRDRPGIVEAARGGTVFFDEIGEIPLEFQPKLLRFLQEKEYRPVGAPAPRKADVRVIAATNRNLEAMCREGNFREDLLYRLDVLRIDLPPLRDRRGDIPHLVRHFLEQAAGTAGKRLWFDPDAEAFLQQHDWPGNVRQLRNLVWRLAASLPAGAVSAADVRRHLEVAPPAPEQEEPADLDEVEKRQILRVLEQTGGNKTRAAKILGIQRRTLYKKLARIQREQSGHTLVPGAPE